MSNFFTKRAPVVYLGPQNLFFKDISGSGNFLDKNLWKCSHFAGMTKRSSTWTRELISSRYWAVGNPKLNAILKIYGMRSGKSGSD